MLTLDTIKKKILSVCETTTWLDKLFIDSVDDHQIAFSLVGNAKSGLQFGGLQYDLQKKLPLVVNISMRIPSAETVQQYYSKGLVAYDKQNLAS